MFPPNSFKLPETFHQQHLPQWAESMRQDDLKREGVTSADDPKRETIFRRRKADYFGMVKCIDDNVGRVLDTLQKHGLSENTLIIFTSDHGQYMGEHGIYFKNALYEPAHHVGMMMSWPGHIPAGSMIDPCVANVDLLPTLAGLLGLKTSGREQGKDASPLLRRETIDWEDVAFIHKDNFSQSGLFTSDWELGLARDGDSVLFDRRKDPLQVNNLYSNKEYISIVKALTARTILHNRKVGNTAALNWLGELLV
jgi:arylsulfatase A-like enzyme